MTPEQKQIILDYAQELQHNDEPWEQFQFDTNEGWKNCTPTENPVVRYDRPAWTFRRRPKTITVTMKMPTEARFHSGWSGNHIIIVFDDNEKGVETVNAIRAEMEKVE